MARLDGNGGALARARRRDREPGYTRCKTSCKRDLKHNVTHELEA